MGKRRPSGDGMVRKRESGNWEGRIVAGHKKDGAPIFHHVYAPTQKELLSKLHRDIEVYQDAELTEDSFLTLGEWLDKWLNEYLPGTVRASTLAGHRGYVERNIKPTLGYKRITTITPEDIQMLYRHLKENGRAEEHPEYGYQLSDNTIRRIHGTLHLAMKTAQREHLIARNPTEGAVIPRKQNGPKRVLTDSELDTFMDAIKKDALWYDFFYTAITTGLRRGEMCGLRWTDFDERKGTLKVCRTIHIEMGKAVAGPTKTGQGNRTIVLPNSTAEVLRQRKEKTYSEWIFPNLFSPERPLSPSTAYHQLKEILSKAGLPNIRFHDLRHTFATHALACGVDAKTLSGILGHTNASFTLDTYTHVTTDMQKQASTIVGNFMEDIFGKELKPWQRSERTVLAAST